MSVVVSVRPAGINENGDKLVVIDSVNPTHPFAMFEDHEGRLMLGLGIVASRTLRPGVVEPPA